MRGYPLSALFMLVAVCAVLAAMSTPAATVLTENRVSALEVVQIVGAATLGSTILGGIVGLYHYRRLRGLAWGILAGVLVGVMISPLMLVPQDSAVQLVLSCVGGSCILLAIGAASRFTSRTEPLVLEPPGTESVCRFTNNGSPVDNPTG